MVAVELDYRSIPGEPQEDDSFEPVIPDSPTKHVVQSRLTDFDVKKRTSTSIAIAAVKGDLNMTIAQFFRNGGTIAANEDERDHEASTVDENESSPIFLEDLETYKAYL